MTFTNLLLHARLLLLFNKIVLYCIVFVIWWRRAAAIASALRKPIMSQPLGLRVVKYSMSDLCLTPDVALPYVSTHRHHPLRHNHANHRHACLSRHSAGREAGSLLAVSARSVYQLLISWPQHSVWSEISISHSQQWLTCLHTVVRCPTRSRVCLASRHYVISTSRYFD